jgi:C4-dicarboxylate transporter DctM subunit
MITALLIAILVIAIFGAPIFAALAALAAVGAESVRGNQPFWEAVASQMVRVIKLATSAEGEILSTIPLFTFMGYVLADAKTADRLVTVARAWVGWIPGGLAIVTILVCAIFTTVTGASGVTIVAVGGLVMPSLIKDRYDQRFSLGLVTGTGSIGLLFPPSLPLIIFGIVYGISAQGLTQSTGDTMTLVHFDLQEFLLAGIVPGLVLIGLFSIYAVYRALKDGVPRERFEWRRAWPSLLRALPELLIPPVMIVLLVKGFQIPEAAANTTLYVVVLEVLVYRDVPLKELPRIVRESLKLVGAIFILIIAATALTDYFVTAKIPDTLTEWINRHIESKWMFLLALNGMLLVVGCIMDIFSALVVIVPLIVPTAAAYGIDPYHLGIVFLLNLEVGFITPPVGLNLFISSYRFNRPMQELYRAIIPFGLIMLVALAIVTYVPGLTVVTAGDPDQREAAGPAAPAQAVDAGVRIVLSDGGVWTPDRCEVEEIKDDPLAYAECQNLFKLYPRCDELADELDRLECRQEVLEGENPFEEEEGDGDGEGEGEGEEGDGAEDAAP